MQITVFGASGKVGRLVVTEALGRGYTVVAFVHKNNPFDERENLRVVQGDIYNATDVKSALQGSGVVLSCLGSWGTKQRNVLTVAMQSIIPAMAEQKILRIVTVTGSGAIPPSNKPGIAHKLLLTLLSPFPAGKVFHDGEEHMRMLQQSDLDWTTVRSPVMTNSSKSAYLLSEKAGGPFATIPRQAVVAAMIDLVEDTPWHRKAPAIHSAK